MRIAIVLRRVLWAVVVVMAAATAAELLLQARSRRTEAARPLSDAQKLEFAYDPFGVQHLHPQYFFFFPLDPVERLAMNNAIVSIDAEGFREPGLRAAGDRPLAVLLGGSTVFGHYASSNATTITSNLNALQRERFFLNAGVPSWTSTQQLIRLVVQIADLRPALVVTLDGVNDAALSGRRSPRTGRSYPPGTPESFDDLERHVDDIRSGRRTALPPLFPELSLRFRKLLRVRADTAPWRPEVPPTPEQVIEAARTYLSNQLKMAAVADSFGARFVSVFQPVGEADATADSTLTQFHDYVVQHAPQTLEFHDLFRALHQQERDGLSPFFDTVHLSDQGNELIARALLAIVRESPASR